ncbi:ABC transporter ATP-binding protein [Bacillus thermocopriae]|uniref:ABC transporter ATP-binding protein n=1 Tax=Neobacillus thermocopriae TaxID=1215031 RepID=A0A6B3TSN0_9BACI|nr:ABC transporter ATP-binding protein [Neobacillus thermocopriae]MED3624452.1 ABC transporter ATP-binding protein [Neobacillus thermocopriae]MED3714843.1 ABC transporter ATP-binding protein [Neobacillus thermocopriae]NEX78717.1 ABC transporter ATP-binding protein [Neobacillus thermocopriae]
MTEVLQVKNINKIYDGKAPFQALTNVSFMVDKGEFIAIMGPSGSGKTTLLNLISTIDRPTSGEILINGREPHKLKKAELANFRRRELGFVFQDFNLLDTLTLEENMILPLTLERTKPSMMDERVESISKKLGIHGILNKRTYEVSGGQKQRTAIARAIIHQPSLLLADEPTGNLDSKASKDVMETLQSINEKDQTTMLMVTHDPYAASYCHRVIFIKDGKLYNEIYRGTNQKVFFQQIMDVLSMLGGDGR